MLCIIFTQARDKAAMLANIRIGYHATGIQPFNASIIMNKAFATGVTHSQYAKAPITAVASLKTQNDSLVPGIPDKVAYTKGNYTKCSLPVTMMIPIW